MPTPMETCDKCGFDAADWNDLDTLQTIDAAPALLHQRTEHQSDADRGRRPSPERWSVNEYIEHTREVFFGMRRSNGCWSLAPPIAKAEAA